MYINAAEYLQEIRARRIEIHNKSRELKELEYMIGAVGINYDKDIITSSPRQDGLERKAIAHMEKSAKIREEIAENIRWMHERMDEAVNYISQIESDDQKEVLMLRYIECKTWSEILVERGCDDIRNQYRLHERALESFQKVINQSIAIP